jgi:hypothetical protein
MIRRATRIRPHPFRHRGTPTRPMMAMGMATPAMATVIPEAGVKTLAMAGVITGAVTTETGMEAGGANNYALTRTRPYLGRSNGESFRHGGATGVLRYLLGGFSKRKIPQKKRGGMLISIPPPLFCYIRVSCDLFRCVAAQGLYCCFRR